MDLRLVPDNTVNKGTSSRKDGSNGAGPGRNVQGSGAVGVTL